MTNNHQQNNQNKIVSSNQKLTRYSSELLKRGLNLAKSIEKETITPDDWRLKGNDLFRNGAYEEALICYEKALEINRNYSLAWNNRGSVFGMLKRYEEALLSYEKALEIQPNDDMAWKNKAKILGSKFNRYEEAIYCYEQVLKINPNDA